jgi:hypothetical protein
MNEVYENTYLHKLLISSDSLNLQNKSGGLTCYSKRINE